MARDYGHEAGLKEGCAMAARMCAEIAREVGHDLSEPEIGDAIAREIKKHFDIE